jgi:hypothetical protein
MGQLRCRDEANALDCRAVTKEKGALIPYCEECRELWLPGDRDRWHAYWIDDGEEDKLLFYCPECADREFGDSG